MTLHSYKYISTAISYFKFDNNSKQALKMSLKVLPECLEWNLFGPAPLCRGDKITMKAVKPCGVLRDREHWIRDVHKVHLKVFRRGGGETYLRVQVTKQ